MVAGGLKGFSGTRVLLLQGPMGPFFFRLAKDLRKAGAEVYKINFNMGDWLFYPLGGQLFRDRFDKWPQYLARIINQHRIDIILFFGDCRPIHRVAKQVAEGLGVEVGVFEEGYLRPDFITLERNGVNGFSELPKDSRFYLKQPLLCDSRKSELCVGPSIYHATLWAILYYLAAGLPRPWITPHYRHHRPICWAEAYLQIRGIVRRYIFERMERGILDRLISAHHKKYFLVPLQLCKDTQIRIHSKIGSNHEFIRLVLESFSRAAPADCLIVLKQHPLDRAYAEYSGYIRSLAAELGITDRCYYIHDQHLPTLLKHARGAVLINSTAGIQSLFHGCPVKCLGVAIYNFEGLCFQDSLDEFFEKAHELSVDRELFAKFRNYVLQKTQINGNFYRRLESSFASGLNFSAASREDTDSVHTDNVKVPHAFEWSSRPEMSTGTDTISQLQEVANPRAYPLSKDNP